MKNGARAIPKGNGRVTVIAPKEALDCTERSADRVSIRAGEVDPL